jgi:plasmid rolling circle replication initiator protein Rep
MILANFPDYCKLSKVSPKDSKWCIKKDFNYILFSGFQKSTYIPMNYDRKKYALRLLKCSYNLQFLFGKDSSGNLQTRLTEARFCRINVCPICHWRWALKWRYYLNSVINQIQLEHPSYRFLFLTLTLKNCDISELSSTLAWMSESWNRMMMLKEVKGNSAIKGIFRCLEISRSKNGQAHPHYHCLICVSSTYFKSGYYLTFDDYQRIWRSSLQINYDPSVFIKAVQFLEDYEWLSKDKMKSKIYEITKYLTKTSDLIQDIEWTLELADHLFRVRRVSATGIFKEKLKGIREEDYLRITDLEQERLEPESLRLYEWFDKLKEYVEDETQRVCAKEVDPGLEISEENFYGQFDSSDL